MTSENGGNLFGAETFSEKVYVAALRVRVKVAVEKDVPGVSGGKGARSSVRRGVATEKGAVVG